MSLNDLRSKIDQIDERLVDLLNERAELSLAIGKHKLKNQSAIYAPNRELQVLKQIAKMNKGPMSNDCFLAIYREIMSSSLALEKPLTIAHLGPEGSFSHLASTRKFGSQVSYHSCTSIPEVFEQVEYGESDYGVVPIENSVEGAVTPTFDCLVDSELKICAQIMQKISHNLLSNSPMEDIKKIYSISQVFGQCRQWLLRNFPHIQDLEVCVGSTTQAASMASREKGAAAIASILAADIYKLAVVKKNVQDIAHNTTRFLVISKQDVPRTGSDRTSILFSIKDKVGALHAMIEPFYKHKINLTKIESRPSKKRAWDYYFFVDFEGHREDKNVQKALTELEDMCKYLKVLGSYPV